MIEITSDEMERAAALLADIPKGAERVFANAMNRGLSRIKTKAVSQIKKVYAVDDKALQDTTKIEVKRANTGNLVGHVSFSGTKIPLYKFNVTPKEPGAGGPVKAGVMKSGSMTTFKDAFIAQMPNGHKGIFERIGIQGIKSRTSKYKASEHTEKISEIMGLSAAQMAGNDSNIEILEKETQELVNKRIIHEMDRILNGYGG